MADLFENPMGLMGFEFVEFASPVPGTLEPIFEKLGFTKVAVHRSKDVVLYRQGEINFIVNNEPKSAAAYFAAEHGASACGMAFRVKDAHKAYARALELGAIPMEIPTGPMELRLPAIKGIGGAPLYLIDRFDEGDNTGKSIYDIDFEFIEGVERNPKGHGMQIIDHLTHNVYRGRMSYWAGFYEKLFNFREIRYFDIQGEYTGLTSKAMTAPDGKIRIPLNEESKSGGGQIEEFLLKFNGEGIQHIALLTEDIFATVDSLRAAGIPLDGRAAGNLLRDAGSPPAGPRRRCRRPQGARPAGRRQGRGRFAAPAAADLLREPAGAGVLRVHPAQGRRRLWRGQLQGAVRVDGAGSAQARGPEDCCLIHRNAAPRPCARRGRPPFSSQKTLSFQAFNNFCEIPLCGLDSLSKPSLEVLYPGCISAEILNFSMWKYAQAVPCA
jgi:4-hydroxyphenylpyruvate dioxygenase